MDPIEIDEEAYEQFADEGGTASDKEALDILRDRLPAVSGHTTPDMKERMARVVLALIPADKRNVTFLRNINLVPLLSSFADIDADESAPPVPVGQLQTRQGGDVGAFTPMDFTNQDKVRIEPWTRRMGARYAQKLKEDQRKIVRAQLEAQNPGVQISDEDVRARADVINEGPVSTYVATTEAAVTTSDEGAGIDEQIRAENAGGTADGASVTVENPAGFNFSLDDVLGEEAQDPLRRPGFMTQADIDMFFRTSTPTAALNQYQMELSARRGFNDQRLEALRDPDNPMPYDLVGPEAPSDDLRFQYKDEVDLHKQLNRGPGGTSMNAPPGGTRWNKKTYTMTETMDLPETLTRQELKTLTDRMREAGLFESTGEPNQLGNPTDPNFKQAWHLLMSQAQQLDKPMWEILGEGISAREEIKAEKRDSFVAKLSDPASIRASAQALGRQMLGRNVSPEEAEQLIEQIHGWERDQQRALFDAAANAEDGEMNTDGDIVDVDWEARMSEELRAQNPDEAAAKDQVNQYESFRSMLGGPGYGPTRRGVNR